MHKKYEILAALPAYGPMYIPVSENGEAFYSEGFVVRFFREDGSSWVANCKPGCTELKGIHEFPDRPELLVIARGTCYLINPEETHPLAVFGFDYEAVLKAPDKRLVLHNSTVITVIETNCQYWHSERISWDGLAELQLEGRLVRGVAYDPVNDCDEWKPFTFDLDTREITGGSYIIHQNKKPWWQFW